MHVKILGPGCKRCRVLESRTREAIAELDVGAEVEVVSDMGVIAGYGILQTPALVVDDVVLVSGRVPPVRELAGLLTDR
ncbi:MAG: thioredoxin family protein [Actinomycetota bacterium]